MKLTLITGNKDKYKSAKQYFDKLNLQFDHQSLDIVEPQDSNIEKIVKYKITQAYDQLKSPVIISDTGWSIPALNGFPGPFMHYINKWLDNQTLQNMLIGKSDRTIIMENTLAYKDSKQLKVFKVLRKGKIIEIPMGEGTWVDQIVTFRKDNKTIAQCANSKLDIFDENQSESLWVTFANWYKNEF